MRFQQVALRQWNLDHLHQTGTPLELFPPAMLLHIFGIKWQYHIPNSEILSRAGFPSMHSLLSQRRLRWLGPVHRMDDGHIPKKVLYRQLITGVGKVGCAALRFKDAWKHDLKAFWSKQLGRSAIDRARLRRTMKEGTRKQMWNVTRKLKKSAFAAKKALLCLPSTSSSPCAVGTATLALAYTATQEVAEPSLID